MLADAVAIIGTMVCLWSDFFLPVLSVLLCRILCLGMMLLCHVCLFANTPVILLSEVDR
jgi:hypothetical protein